MYSDKDLYELGPDSICEHGKLAETCKRCRRLDEAWEDFGEELRRMGEEEPGW